MHYNNTKTPYLTLPLLVSILLFSISTTFAQDSRQKNTITKSYNPIKTQEIQAFFKKEFELKQKSIEALLRSNNLKSTYSKNNTTTNLVDLGTDGTPLFYQTLYISENSRDIHNAEITNITDMPLEGYGMEVGIWDEGVALSSHQEFDERVNKLDGSNKISNHTTLVTGALVASGVKAKAKGSAAAATTLSYDWVNDKGEVVEQASKGMLVSNHSYGIDTRNVPDWYFGSYIQVSQHWDRIMYNFPYYLMVTAAGNSQKSKDNESPISGESSNGFDLLLGFTTAKNNMVVAGANTRYKNGTLSNADVSNYSSFGPVDDGRIKPDIAAHGNEVFSASSQSNTSYHTSTGTSMATPEVTGTLLVLQQHYFELFDSYMKAATLKGLTLHTADDIDLPGPDYKMGWGIINPSNALKHINNKELSTLINEETIAAKESKTYTVIANGNEPLIASISWTDPEGSFINRGDLNNTKAALINDLDIRVTKNGKTYYPWLLNAMQVEAPATTGNNSVDPFERINIENATGEYTITITHKGELKHGAQNFSLLVSGAKLSNCAVATPSNISIESTSDKSVTIKWDGSQEALHEFHYKSEMSDTWNVLYTPENTITLNRLEIGTYYAVKVKTLCTLSATSSFTEEIDFLYSGANTILSVDTKNENPKIKVYPNPTVDAITVHSSFNTPSNYNIITTSGTIVKFGEAEERINVTDLKSGMYILTLESEDGMASTKFFKD